MSRRVAILMFDDVEVLDFAGPFEVFGLSGASSGRALFDVFTVARELRPVLAWNRLSVNPDHSFGDCPAADILVVPGGLGTRRGKHDPAIIDFVRERAAHAERVLSVCSGALLLAKAGLMSGLHATTHRGALRELAEDAPDSTLLDSARVVDNGRFVFSAGVSAGIDAALHIVSELHGPDEAAQTATLMEYDWRYRLVDGRSVVKR